jgi:hypothetical protein
MKKISSLPMMATLTLTLIAVALIVKASPSPDHAGPYYKVEPELVTMGPGSAVNQTFTVAVKLYNVTTDNVPAGIAGVEIHFYWDPDLLAPVTFTNQVATAGGVLNATGGTILYGISPGFYNDTGGTAGTLTNYRVAAASTGAAPPWWGNGTVVEITLKVIYQGWWYRNKSCTLELRFTDIVDANGYPIIHDAENGLYKIIGKNPSPVPAIMIVPSVVTEGPEAAINETFTIAAKIYNVTVDGLPPPYGIYGIEVHLTWNDTLIKPVSYQQHVGDTTVGVLNPPLFFIYDNLTDNGYNVSATSLPPALPWNGTDKTIFEITFRVVLQKVEPFPDISSLFHINYSAIAMAPDDSIMGQEIPLTTEDGAYQLVSFPQVNVYTVTYMGNTYQVTTEADSIIFNQSNLDFNDVLKSISFNVTTSDGFVNVTIPNNLMWGTFTVNVDGADLSAPNMTTSSNSTHTSIWFNFTQGFHVVTISSTGAIPEFSGLTFYILMATIAIVVVGTKKIIRKKSQATNPLF